MGVDHYRLHIFAILTRPISLGGFIWWKAIKRLIQWM